MPRNQQKVSASGTIVSFIMVLNAIIMERGLVATQQWYWLLLITVPVLLSFIPLRQKSS
jgi:hypothetical protein